MRSKNFIILVCLYSIICYFELPAQWTDLTTSQVLNASDTTITQYTFSDDNKSVYVLDARNIIRKYDLESGNFAWSKNLSIKNYEGFQFLLAELSEKGDMYSICFNKNDSLILVCNDVNTDENKYILVRKIYKFSSAIKCLFSNNILYLFNYYKFNSSEHWKNIIGDGVAWTYCIINTKPWISGDYKLNSFISGKLSFNNSSVLINSSYIEFNMEEGTVKKDSCFNRLVYYNPDINRWTELLNKRFNYNGISKKNLYDAFAISKNGMFSAVQDEDMLCFYDNINANLLKKNYYVDTISSIMFSPDSKNLIIGAENKIEVISTNDMKLNNVSLLPELNGYPELINSFNNSAYLYFINKNRIFRIQNSYNTDSLDANFYSNTTISQAGDTVKFFDASTGSPDSYLWDFGDGKISTEQSPTHIYTDSGLYSVKLTVKKGNQSDSIAIEKAVKVIQKLVSDFNYSIDESVCPPNVTFTNISKGNIDSVKWDFGDLTKNQVNNPEHYYRFPGAYNVILKIYGSNFNSQISKLIEINDIDSPFDSLKFAYEYVFAIDTGYCALHAYELGDKSNICNLIKENSCILRKYYNQTESLWEKTQKTYWSSNLRILNNEIVYSYHDTLQMMNYDGLVLKSKGLNRPIQSIACSKNKIYMGYTIFNADDGFSFNYKAFDTDLNLLESKFLCGDSFDEYTTGGAAGGDCFFDYQDGLNHLIKYHMKSYEKGGYEHSKSFLVYNSKSIVTDYYQRINDYIKLSPNRIVFADNFSKLYVYDTLLSLKWVKEYDTLTQFYSHLKLNDTCFIAAGRIDEKPGYVIFNDKGDIIDSATLDCRYGAFMHVSVTPDTNLLLSGYKSTDAFGGKVPYFVKTNSKLVKSLVMGAFLEYNSIDEIKGTNSDLIIPNPANDFIELPGEAGSAERIRIYSTGGARVFEGKYTQKIDVSHLDKGMYFLMACEKVYKFIKL